MIRACVVVLAMVLTLLSAPPARAQDAIRIGITAPITGGLANIYSIQGKLWEAWEQAQNEAGGIYVKSLNKKLPIKIVYYDDKSDPKVSVKFYEKLINDDKVHFLIGPPGSPIAFGATTVAERYKFPMILGASNDPQIYKRGFKYIQGVMDVGSEWSRLLFDMLAKQKRAKTAAFLTEDVLYARGVALGAREFAKTAGMKIVFDQTAPSDAEDFTPIITQMKAAAPDLVYVATFPPFYIKFAKQAAELGLRPPALHCSTCSAASVRNALGPLAEQVTGEVFWVPGMKLGDYKMLEATLQKSGLDPVQWTFALISLPAFEVLRAGIEKAGTLDREAVFQAVKSMEITTVMGPYRAKGDGVGTITPFPIQVQNGKVVVLWPPEAKTADYVYPRQR
ncbi:MAG: amino acid ABC transporter substrate-binding protein [Candidatus Rokubacteria bacterium]|nr:amino acid ABC transporter substrate-binding protein [Candidatus Rokubacteria bacterium]